MTIDKEIIKLSVKRVLLDRPFMSLLAAVVVAGFVYCLVIGANVRYSDVTVYSRYTAFGEAHFYKDHWQYMINFVVFGAVVSLGHVILMIKLHGMERRQTAILVGWAAIVILIVACMYTLGVMSLGRSA